MSMLPDEWPPKRARSLEDWGAYWTRQRWDRRFRHDHVSPFLMRWKRRLWSTPQLWMRQARWFAQRGRRGWATCDTWGMDGYICRVLGEMTAYLNEHRYGYACQGTTECWTAHPETCSCETDWQATLEKIAGPLVAYKDHRDFAPGGDPDWQAKEQAVTTAAQDALRLLADNLPSLWD